MVDISSFWILFLVIGIAMLGFFVALMEELRTPSKEDKKRIILCIISFVIGIGLTVGGVVLGEKNSCPNCHEFMNTEFCTSCGTSMDQDALVPACPACGAKYDTVYCGNCGARMNLEGA